MSFAISGYLTISASGGDSLALRHYLVWTTFGRWFVRALSNAAFWLADQFGALVADWSVLLRAHSFEVSRLFFTSSVFSFCLQFFHLILDWAHYGSFDRGFVSCYLQVPSADWTWALGWKSAAGTSGLRRTLRVSFWTIRRNARLCRKYLGFLSSVFMVFFRLCQSSWNSFPVILSLQFWCR